MGKLHKYSRLMVLNHWLMAVIIIGLLGVGLYMTSLPDSDQKWEIYNLHKSFGVIAFVLVIFRLITRFASKVPPLPLEISQFEAILAKIEVILLYGLILSMTISGYVMSMASGYGTKVFGYPIYNIFSEKNIHLAGTAHYVHVVLPYFFIALILLHILASAKHYCIDKVNLFKRMV